MKNYISAAIFSISIILAAYFLSNAYVERSQSHRGTVSVTGLGKANINSDLIVWEGQFTSKSNNLKEAYAFLNQDKHKVIAYLKSNGIKVKDIVFNAVSINKEYKNEYSASGKYIGNTFVGYELKQNLTIESKNVEHIESISRNITELLNDGVQFYSRAPRYYYTQLADLKIKMISEATKDAYDRAKTISEFSSSQLGQLVSAKMGVFQITGQNSNEDYSWSGAYNTSSKNKTASITMKLVYKVE